MKMRVWVAAGVLTASGCGEEGPVGPASNRAPEIRNLSVSPAVIPLGGTALVTVEAGDPDGDQIFYRFDAAGGTVTADPSQPGRASYRNDGIARGSDQVRVTVTDSNSASTSGVASVTLQGNRAPTLNLRALITERACHPPCSLTILANADDADGDGIRYTWSGCTTGVEPTSRCVIDVPGTHTAGLVIEDGRGGVATGSLTLEGRNGAPTVGGGRTFSGAGPERFLIHSDDPDPDEELLCGWWGNCQCTGSNQSFNLVCSLPADLDRCFMRFSCSDPWGASAQTRFELVR
jgi:hypothetical protein